MQLSEATGRVNDIGHYFNGGAEVDKIEIG